MLKTYNDLMRLEQDKCAIMTQDDINKVRNVLSTFFTLYEEAKKADIILVDTYVHLTFKYEK